MAPEYVSEDTVHEFEGMQAVNSYAAKPQIFKIISQ